MQQEDINFDVNFNNDFLDYKDNGYDSIEDSFANTISESLDPDMPLDSEYDNYNPFGSYEDTDYRYSSLDRIDGMIEEDISNNVCSPYDSGFDDEHPIPSYKELRNAGFTDFEAKQIIYGNHEIYSDKELYDCLYGSENPKEAYDAMIRKKTDEAMNKIDDFMFNI